MMPREVEITLREVSLGPDRSADIPILVPIRSWAWLSMVDNRYTVIRLRQLLSEIPRTSEFVFPGRGNSGHVVEIKKGWASICKAAGITGLRIHDLRHSFASQLASGGASTPGPGNASQVVQYNFTYTQPYLTPVAAAITGDTQMIHHVQVVVLNEPFPSN